MFYLDSYEIKLRFYTLLIQQNNGNISMSSLNETGDLSKFIGGLSGELCFPLPL